MILTTAREPQAEFQLPPALVRDFEGGYTRLALWKHWHPVSGLAAWENMAS